MKTIRLLFAVMSCLLLLRATCVVGVAQNSPPPDRFAVANKSAANPKNKSVDVDRQNKPVNHRTFPVRPLNTVPFTKPSPNNLHNHGPAIIGGPANKHASAINGTRMKRKP
jgi:hypothetical protein